MSATPLDMGSIPPRRDRDEGGHHPPPPPHKPGEREALLGALDKLRAAMDRLPASFVSASKVAGFADFGRSAIAKVAELLSSPASSATPRNNSGPAPGAPTPVTPGRSGIDAFRDSLARVADDFASRLGKGAGQARKGWDSGLDALGSGWKRAVNDLTSRWGRSTSSMANGFEKAFDASIGRVISGTGQGITAAARFARQAWSSPIGAARGVASAFGRAGLGASILASYASTRARRAASRAASAFGSFGSGAASRIAGGWSAARAGARRFGQSYGRARRRPGAGFGAARRAFGKASRAFGKAGGGMAGVRAALPQAAMGLGSLGGVAVAGLTQVGAALAGLKLAADAARAFAENVNEGNRALAPYSAHLSGAFTRLDLGDQMRRRDMARETGGSAVTLTEGVNGLRQAVSGMERLQQGVMNRAGILATATLAPGAQMLSDLGDKLNKWMEGIDPGGKGTKGVADAAWDGAAYAAGWVAGLAPGGMTPDQSGRAAADASRQAREERERKAGQEMDGWSRFIEKSKKLKPLNPARPLK